MADITSNHNPRLKAALKLRDRRDRVREGRFLIYGRREIERALNAGVAIETVFVREGNEANTSHLDVTALVQRLRILGAQVFNVAAVACEKIAYGDRDDGLVVVARSAPRSLSSLKLPTNSLVAVLEGIEKPGNVGAVLRSADAAGVAAVIVASGSSDIFNPNVIRASLGAIFTVPVCVATSEQTLAWLQDRNFSLFAARVDGAVDYCTMTYRSASAIILGSEAHGLSDVWRDAAVTPIFLPMLGDVDSLNVSATAAVLFYEAARQRRSQGGSA